MNCVLTTAEIAAMVGGTVLGPGDLVIRGLAKIEDAGPDEVTFVANARYFKQLMTTRAGAALVAPGTPHSLKVMIEVGDPYRAFQQLLPVFHPRIEWLPRGIHATAVIDPTAQIGKDVAIGAFTYVGPRATIGDRTTLFPHVVIAGEVSIGEDCEIHSHVSIREGVVLSNGVVVQDGAVVGSDGFGFAPGASGYDKVPQLGIVRLESSVEIGANTTIDRATLGQTVIGTGTKLDNLIQVAHNVKIGSHTVIAAQSGISGSTTIGDHCRIGGQVGIVGHLKLGDGVGIGAQSGVSGGIADGELYSGSPARPHSLWKKIEAAASRLPELLKRVRKLESAVFGPQGAEDKVE